jgi:hypothetical protein
VQSLQVLRQTAIYVPSYCYIFLLTLLYMCPGGGVQSLQVLRQTAVYVH